MENLDLLYRAYSEYKKLCITDDDTSRFYRAYVRNNLKEHEDTVHIFNLCKIDEDWVKAMEEGLVFFEKAIKEDRQFIRNDGEVTPVEKVRKVAKESIQDLAKHASYITHEAPDTVETDVLPDKLLVIRKESDYAIYENRVLYTGLMYLKDFVMSRLETIKEATNTYQVKQHITKMIDMGARKIDVKLTFDEKRTNDPLLSENNTEKDIIDRLDAVLTMILALLKTPLMREVSKVDMVSRPIQKTNILKMNRNFREALALFDYIASYQGQGFTIEHIERSYYPLTKEMSESYSENLILLSFLNYIYTNELTDKLEKRYRDALAEEQRMKEDEILAKLRSFHADAKEKEKTINEYFILFEQGYRILEKRNDELVIQIKTLEAEHKKEIELLKLTQQEEIKRITKEAEQKIEEKERETEERIKKLEEEQEERVQRLIEDSNKEIAAMSMRLSLEKDEFKRTYKDHVEQMEIQNEEYRKQAEEAMKYKSTLEAQLISYKGQNGILSPAEFNAEEEFDKLEKIKADFDKFYDAAWKEAKKKIRAEVLKGGKKK